VIAADNNAFGADPCRNGIEMAGYRNVLVTIRSEQESMQVSVAGDIVSNDVALRIDAPGLRE
jgi:hypothetical protein